jgi:hypothetical protein
LYIVLPHCQKQCRLAVVGVLSGGLYPLPLQLPPKPKLLTSLGNFSLANHLIIFNNFLMKITDS